MLNQEQCHFIVKEGIVLGYKLLGKGIQVDHLKVKVIAKFPPSISVKGVQSFLGHVVLYCRFIKYFSKISHPICKLLEKEAVFEFDCAFLKALTCLKQNLISALIIVAPNWFVF